MLKELLPLLPDAVTRIPTPVAVGAAAAGIGLWLVGGRYSRAILTLVMVAVGAFVGLHLPRRLGWSIDGAAVGVSMAIALGASAYFLHRAWVGALFGTVMALWSGAAVWVALAPVAKWRWPKLQWTGDAAELLAQIRRSLPADIQTITPVACGCGMVAGVAIALLWPRLSRALFFSILGVSVVLVIGMPVVVRHRPAWLELLPARAASQAIGLLGLVVIGTLVQWWLVLKETPAAPPAEDEPKAKRPAARQKTTVKARETARAKSPNAKRVPAAATGNAMVDDDPDELHGGPTPPGVGAAATEVSA